MVAISSVGTSSLNPAATSGTSVTGSPASSKASTAGNATNAADPVAIGQAGASPVYTLAQLSPTYAWERASSDAMSARLAGNVLTSKVGSRFAGLGAALLERFRTDGSDYSQSVIEVAPGAQANDVKDARFQATAANEVGLTLTLRSGATVTLTLGSDKDRLAVRVAVTGGTLTGADRNALAGLSDAFQTTIDALGEVPPRLDVGGLLDTDASVFASVNLHAKLDVGQNHTQTIDLVANDQQRAVSVKGPTGDIDVKVDMANAATLGSADQQASAIRHYLEQFDAAKSRGQGDPSLMAMFKDAFATLHGHRDDTGTKTGSNIASPSGIRLSAGDHGMMTGLGDFEASVSQATKASNPLRPEEVDAFSYEVSQRTEISGDTDANRSVHQTQEAKLDASFHRSLFGDTALMLTESRYSQNYTYEEIHDKASSDMELAYDDGDLVKASITQAADQSRRVRKYELGHLEGDTTSPASQSRTFDVVGMIQAAADNDAFHSIDKGLQRDDIMSRMHDSVLLRASTAQLAS